MDEMSMNKRDKKLLELAANGGGDKEMLILEQMNELEDKFDSTVEEIKKSVPDLDKILNTIKAKDPVLPSDQQLISLIKPLIPEPIPGDNYILTDRDKQQIARSITVPVIEKTTERTEVIREQPIVTEITKVTNEIKEVAVGDTPDEVIKKINLSKLFISKDRIEGLIEALGQAFQAGVGITTTIFFRNGSQVGRAKNINFTGSAVSSVAVIGDTAQVTLTGGTGGGQVNSVVAGTGISVDSTDPANPIVSATGGTGFSLIVPTGTVNGINTSFTFSTAPSVIVLDNGNIMNKVSKDSTVNWTGTTNVTLSQAPNFNIFGF